MTALLNLARKWRSQNFDQIVGQAITVRILKNTLYSSQYFPVYLFSGQKGCGKTSAARIFAGAVNCHKLADFQKNPRSTLLPCSECPSCKAMAGLQHPDFIEIDAASHTGVDNVRTIIDAASLMPVLGTKKIYLIDEAHMLSKSAFNAFLKILEEPPMSVIFILATTDPHKIIDTVRSRCFQLFFDPLTIEQLTDHLEIICKTEHIQADREALKIIAQETMGCVRDALNLLEQLRFAYTHLTAEIVIQNLGYLADHSLHELYACIFKGSTQEVIVWLDAHKDALRSPLTVWAQCKNYIRTLLGDSLHGNMQNQLITCLSKLYEYELPLHKSTQQQGLLELMFIEMSQKCTQRSSLQLLPLTPVSVPQQKETPVRPVEVRTVNTQATKTIPIAAPANEKSPLWNTFLHEIENFSDPLLSSIFKQAVYKKHEGTPVQVEIEIAQHSPFFKEWIRDTEKIWSPLVEKHFGSGTKLQIKYLENTLAKEVAPVTPVPRKITVSEQTINTKRNNPIDISDKTVWKTAHTLIEAFGGTITESKDDQKIT